MRILLLSLMACSADKGADSVAPVDSDLPYVAPVVTLSEELVDLGEVEAPEESQEVLVVQNQGPGQVTIVAAELEAGASGLAVLPSESFPLVLDERQTTGLGLRCRPTEALSVTDNVAVTVSWVTDEGVEQRQVITAEVRCAGFAPMIELVTSDIAFDPLGIPCEAEGTWELQNVGNRPGSITAVNEVNGGDFSVYIDLLGQLPWQLSPGVTLSLPVVFAPTQQGPQEIAVTLEQELGEPLTLTASGEGFFDEPTTQSFTIPPADLLITVDHSAYAVAHRGSEELPTLFSALDNSGLDWQVAAITRDDGCVDGGTLYIDGSVPNAERGALMDAQWFGSYGGYTEAGFTLLERALDEAGVGGCNEGLRRSEASLTLLAVSDEEEQSTNGYTYFVSRFTSEVSDPALLTINAIAGDYPSCTNPNAERGFYEAAQATGGELYSTCGTDYSAYYEDLVSALVHDRTHHELSGRPLSGTLEVWVDGAPLTSGWSYASVDNAVDFDPILPSGSEVEIRYTPEAPCGR